MSIGQIAYFACWLLLAALGGAALVLGWERAGQGRGGRPEAPGGPRNASLSRVADGLAAAAAASLPWSTTLTGILVAAWFLVGAAAVDLAELRRQIMSPAGGLPLILFAVATLGMAWADVSLIDRWHGLDGFLKPLLVPFLLAHFRHSERGTWVVLAFLGASIVLLLVSWGLALTPGLSWRGKTVGVPVKDYISQSGVFALCAFALLGYAVDLWRSGRWQWVAAPVLLAVAFIANIAYVESARTTLVTSALLIPLFGFRSFGWKGMFGAAFVGVLLAGTFWMSSSYLRDRVMRVVEEVQEYRTSHAANSSGQRLEYWRRSIEAVAGAPVIGHGTGSIPEVLLASGSEETDAASFGTVNPHNQIFVVALQLGLIGTSVLVAMWMAHLWLFRGDGFASWLGLISVVQLIGSSFFNSHLSDFTQGWIYVFAVGVLGGMVLGGAPDAWRKRPSLTRGVAPIGKDR
jgi:O-antigen ligase